MCTDHAAHHKKPTSAKCRSPTDSKKPILVPSTILEIGWRIDDAPSSPILPGPSTSAQNPKPFSQPFPMDLIHNLCGHLKGDKNTLLALQRTNRTVWTIVTPYIYQRIRLRDPADQISFFSVWRNQFAPISAFSPPSHAVSPSSLSPSSTQSKPIRPIKRGRFAWSHVKILELDFWEPIALVDDIAWVHSHGLHSKNKRNHILPNVHSIQFNRGAAEDVMITDDYCKESQILDLGPDMQDVMDYANETFEAGETVSCRTGQDPLAMFMSVYVRYTWGQERNLKALMTVQHHLAKIQNICIHMPKYAGGRICAGPKGHAPLSVVTFAQFMGEFQVENSIVHMHSWHDPYPFAMAAKNNKIYHRPPCIAMEGDLSGNSIACGVAMALMTTPSPHITRYQVYSEAFNRDDTPSHHRVTSFDQDGPRPTNSSEAEVEAEAKAHEDNLNLFRYAVYQVTLEAVRENGSGLPLSATRQALKRLEALGPDFIEVHGAEVAKVCMIIEVSIDYCRKIGMARVDRYDRYRAI